MTSKEMLAVPQGTREKWAQLIRQMKPPLIEKGGFQDFEAGELNQDQLLQYRKANGTAATATQVEVSRYVRIEHSAEEIVIHAGPRQFEGPQYDVESLAFSASSVLDGRSNGYDHGEVLHPAKYDKAEYVDQITQKVFERFDIKCLVNPSPRVCQIAKERDPKILDVYLNVTELNRQEEEDRIRKLGMNIIQKPYGLAFVGREGTRHGYTADKWIALAPVLDSSTLYEWERITTVSLRWGRTRTHEYFFNSPYYFMNQDQTSEYFRIPKAPRLLCSNFHIPASRRDQMKGQQRYLDFWPEEQTEEIDGVKYLVRKKGTTYYDMRLPGQNSPYAVRRGMIREKNLDLIPMTLDGRYAFSLYTIDPVVKPYDPVDYRCVEFRKEGQETQRKGKVNEKKQLGYIWQPYWSSGAEVLYRGFANKVDYVVRENICYGKVPLPKGAIFFRSREKMIKTLGRTLANFFVAPPSVPSDMVLALYEALSHNQSHPFKLNSAHALVREWRSMPNAFLSAKEEPVLLKWSLPELNEGGKKGVYVLKESIGLAELDILRNSGFSVEIVAGSLTVLRDFHATSGTVVNYDGVLTCQPVSAEKRSRFVPEPGDTTMDYNCY